MIKDSAAYNKAVKWVIFLQDLEKNFRISIDDHNKLQELMVAVQQYEDAHDAEVQAEYEAKVELESMQEFEERFLSSMDR
jgi:hypothetical protein